MPPTVDRPEPPYAQIASQIRQKILDGTFPEGAPVPSARQIATGWNVALATATKVLAALRADGLVRTVPGVGTIVAHQEMLRAATENRLSLVSRGRGIYPPGEYAKIVSAEVTTAPNSIADALGIRPGAKVIRRCRVRYRKDTLVSHSTSWYSGRLAEIAPALLALERIEQGTPEYIGQKTGWYVHSGYDQLSATQAGTGVADQLGIVVGSPVLRGRHWMYDDKGDVIEFGESWAMPDRWAFEVRWYSTTVAARTGS